MVAAVISQIQKKWEKHACLVWSGQITTLTLHFQIDISRKTKNATRHLLVPKLSGFHPILLTQVSIRLAQPAAVHNRGKTKCVMYELTYGLALSNLLFQCLDFAFGQIHFIILPQTKCTFSSIFEKKRQFRLSWVIRLLKTVFAPISGDEHVFAPDLHVRASPCSWPRASQLFLLSEKYTNK